MEQIPIPKRLQKRPLYKGLPITFVTFVGPDGMPDFKVLDGIKRRTAVVQNLCGLCGEPNEKIIVLIGGVECSQSHLFLDPAMHVECAQYAVKVCPYLALPNHDYSKADPKHLQDGQSVIRTHEEVNPHRPEKLALFYARSYDLVPHKDTFFVHVKRFTRVDWNIIPQRKPYGGQKDADQGTGQPVPDACQGPSDSARVADSGGLSDVAAGGAETADHPGCPHRTASS